MLDAQPFFCHIPLQEIQKSKFFHIHCFQWLQGDLFTLGEDIILQSAARLEANDDGTPGQQGLGPEVLETAPSDRRGEF